MTCIIQIWDLDKILKIRNLLDKRFEIKSINRKSIIKNLELDIKIK